MLMLKKLTKIETNHLTTKPAKMVNLVLKTFKKFIRKEHRKGKALYFPVGGFQKRHSIETVFMLFSDMSKVRSNKFISKEQKMRKARKSG